MAGAMMVKTCTGCGGQNLKACEPTEEEFTIRRLPDNRVQVRRPLPMLCLDCGGTDSTYQRLKGA